MTHSVEECQWLLRWYRAYWVLNVVAFLLVPNAKMIAGCPLALLLWTLTNFLLNCCAFVVRKAGKQSPTEKKCRMA